jgi:TIR domain
MAYQWDVFLSYPRRDPIGPWVHEHFHPLLKRWLGAAMPQVPKIFLDTQMESGTHWPSNLSQSLLCSRYMIAIWAPPYFGSSWCMAEWETMLARERALGLGVGTGVGLTHPIRYFDGESFPFAAKNVQAPDYSSYSSLPSGTRSRLYRKFEEDMKALSLLLAQRISAVPPWDPTWPLVLPSQLQPEPSLPFDAVGLK